MNKDFKKKFKYDGGAIELSTRKLPVKEQLRLKMQLVQMFADVAGAIGSIFTQEEADSEDLAPAIMQFTSSLKTLDAEELIDLLVTLCEHTAEVGPDKGRVAYDFVFDNLPLLMTYRVALWVLEVNFKDFISGTGLLTTLKKMGDQVPKL